MLYNRLLIKYDLVFFVALIGSFGFIYSSQEQQKKLKNKFYHAVKAGNFQQVQECVSKGVNVNSLHGEETALNIAVFKNNFEMVQLLINAEVDLNLLDANGISPLGCVQSVEMVQKLFLNGANINKVNAFSLESPLHIAVTRGRLDLVNILLEYGADIGAVDQYGQSPLHLAVRTGHVNIVENLLQRGANIDAVDRNGATPLLLAVQHRYVNLVSILLNYRANFNLANTSQLAALKLAKRKKFTDIIKLFQDK